MLCCGDCFVVVGNPFTTEGTLFCWTVELFDVISCQKQVLSKILTHYLIRFICGILRYISLGMDEMSNEKTLGNPPNKYNHE